MSYFSYFPKIIHPGFDNYLDTTEIIDISLRTKLIKAISEATYLYDTYTIRDGDRPDTIANAIYGQPTLHWVVLLVNERMGLSEWPLSDEQLTAYVLDQVGGVESKLYDTHHYVNESGKIVHSTYTGIKYPISIIEYHREINNNRRKIKLIRPELVDMLISEHKELLKL